MPTAAGHPGVATAIGALDLGRRGLVVYVQGMKSRPRRVVTLPPLAARIASTLADRSPLGPGGWDVKFFDHGIGWWSRGGLHTTAKELGASIAAWVLAAENDGRPYEQVVLVGHSMGGMLIRDAWVSARDELGVPGGDVNADWSVLVRRIVLLAAPNAGFVVRRLPIARRLLYVFTAPFSRFVIEDLRKGSAYVTDLRLRWVRRFRRWDAPADSDSSAGAASSRGIGAAGPDLPGVVQVIGTRDSLVTDDDSTDISYMPGSIVTRVAKARHGDLPAVCATDEGFGLFWKVFAEWFDETSACEKAPEEGNVVLLLHGIRAGKYSSWVSDLAAVLEAEHRTTIVRTPAYGYFSALGFANPLVRASQASRFRDWYGRVYIEHPPTRISFAGHSFGTYMLGRSLLRVPTMRFNRVYLAGSVLPRQFPWGMVIDDRGQVVGQVHSDRSTRDWPVGLLCSGLRGLGMSDIGTGGFDGFDAETPRLREEPGWIDGGHGAAVGTPERLRWVAHYLTGTLPSDATSGRTSADDGAPAPVDEAPATLEHVLDSQPKKGFAYSSRLFGRITTTALLAGGVLLGLAVLSRVAGVPGPGELWPIVVSAAVVVAALWAV